MKNHTTIYVIRHGESEGNLPTDSAIRDAIKKHGKLHVPLTENGRKQAEKVAIELKGVQFNAIFASDLTRAIQTAEIIAKQHTLPIITEDSIRERSYGNVFFTHSREKRRRLEKATYELEEDVFLDHRYSDDTESIREVQLRFSSFIKRIAPLYKGKTIAVINHGNVMRSFLIYSGWITRQDISSKSIKNAGYFVLKTDGEKFEIIKTRGIVNRDELN